MIDVPMGVLSSCQRGVPRAFAVAICLAVGAPASAAPGLVDAWHASQALDPSYAAALAGQRAGAAKRRESTATFRPQLMLGAGASYATDDRESTGARFSAPGFGTSDAADFRTRVAGGVGTTWSVDLRQPLYSAAKSATARQLDREADRGDVELEAATQQSMLAVAHAYLEVLGAEAETASLRAQRASIEEAAAAAHALYDEGRLPVTDATEADARLAETDAALVVAENRLAERRATFSDRTGLSAEALRAPRDDPSAAPDPGALEDWLERARHGAPSTRARRVELDVARTEVEKTAREWSPSVDLVARVADDRLHGDSGWGTAGLATRSRVIGVQISVPLFTSGMTSARHDESVARAEAAEAEVRGAELEATRRARAAWLALHAAGSRLTAQRKLLDAALARVDATTLGHEVGARTTLDLLDARSQSDRARLGLEEARLAIIGARLELAAAAGTLTEDELRATDAMLLP